jgi:hypothetical protein
MLRDKIQEIRSVFEQNQNFKQVGEQKSALELEAKFGFYTNRGFNSNVPYVHYDRLLNYLQNAKDMGPEEIEESSVAQFENIRRVNTTLFGDSPEVIFWQRKINIRNIEIYEYDIRISINVEETLEEIPSNFKPTVIRNRTRHSFKNNIIKIDMTEVMMMEEDKVIRPHYEVEVEFIGKSEELSNFSQQLENIFKLLRGTNIIYTNVIKRKLIDDVNEIIGTNKYGMIDKNVLVEARNIKRRDLVYGGIVGNNFIESKNILSYPRTQRMNVPGTNYAITYKADGLRKMLIIHTSGIWLVYPPYEFNLVINGTSNLTQITLFLQKFNGTILDGELVIPKENKNIKYWYLAFDCLSLLGSSKIQFESYMRRRELVMGIGKSIQTPILTIDVKPTEEIKTPRDFFRLVRNFLDNRDKLEYNQDGIMFIPIDVIYNPFSQKYDLKQRKLTRIPDTCKWKEGNDITIDFLIKWTGPGGKFLELYSYDEILKENVLFRGSEINPFTSDMIDHNNELTLGKPSNIIVEYEWINLSNNTKGLLRPRRIRYDKHGPNRLSVAIDNWEDIMKPITRKYITGESLEMTFNYHNRIKGNLYSNLKPNTKKDKFVGINILDIGSGRGGDVSKWKSLTDKNNTQTTGYVVAVEPNMVNQKVLLERIDTFNMNDKITVLPTGGEDTALITQTVRNKIPGGKVDAVTLMLSMSFFWASDQHLDALINTIVNNLKPGGKIAFLTIDGDTVEQIFEPSLGGPTIKDISIGSAKLHLYPKPKLNFGRELDFILPETIVGDQLEYIVHIQDFTIRLSKYGINLHQIQRAEGERLLSEDNLLFSSMYSFGYYLHDSVTPLVKDENLNILPSNIILPPIISTSLKYSDIQMYQSSSTPSQLSIQVPKKSVIPRSPTIIKNLNVIPNKYRIEKNQLPSLSVDYIGKGNRIIDSPAINDDTYAPLKCSWYDNLVRIATIGDGSCFIHAILKSFYSPYQENNNARFRVGIASNLRRDLAILLSMENPEFPGKTFWETSGKGAFPRMVMQQIKNESLIGETRVDYSLNGLQRLFNSYNKLGDEVYKFISDTLDIDIYVLRATSEDLYPHLHTRNPGINRNGVVIIGNMFHYETVGLNTDDGIQTVFSSGDSFLESVKTIFIGDGDYDIINTTYYDPDQTFVKDFVDIFTTNDGFEIPDIINNIFSESDPFIMTLKRLLPDIQEAGKERLIYLQNNNSDTNPVLSRLNKILELFEVNQYDSGQIQQIRRVVNHRLAMNNSQTLEEIIGSAKTDGQLTNEQADNIMTINSIL